MARMLAGVQVFVAGVAAFSVHAHAQEPPMKIAPPALAAALAFHIVGYLPATGAQWLVDNLKNALIINVVLAVFNLFPLSLAGASWSGFCRRQPPRPLRG
jgi:hypothetical protein